MSAVARDLPDVGFRPMREADLDEVLSMEREVCEYPARTGREDAMFLALALG